jgi:hypothetical protein
MVMFNPLKRNDDLLDEYRENNPVCELYRGLQGRNWTRTVSQWRGLGFTGPDSCIVEIHHIFPGIHRWDLLPNIISVCRPAHDYVTDKPYSQNGNVLALWVKSEKGELEDEHIEQMTACFGMNPMALMERWKLTEQWAIDTRDKLLERFLNR